MTAAETAAVIVRSPSELGHNLGLTVVAEGVENQETWRMLAASACDQVQGYGLSRPLPADDLATWVLSYEKRLGRKTEAGVTW